MGINLVAGVIAALVTYPLSLLLDDHVSVMTGYAISTVVGGGVFVYTVYKLKKLRGDF